MGEVMGKVIDLQEYRLNKLNKSKESWQSWIKKLSQEIWYKILVLINNRTFSFLKPIESTQEYNELIDYLRNKWIKDLRVYLKDWTEILDPEQAVWQNTFTFGDDASALLHKVLWYLYECWDLYKHYVTDNWTPIIIFE